MRLLPLLLLALILTLTLAVSGGRRDLRRLKRFFDTHGVDELCEYGTDGMHMETEVDPWNFKHR